MKLEALARMKIVWHWFEKHQDGGRDGDGSDLDGLLIITYYNLIFSMPQSLHGRSVRRKPILSLMNRTTNIVAFAKLSFSQSVGAWGDVPCCHACNITTELSQNHLRENGTDMSWA